MKKSFEEIMEQIKTLCGSVSEFAYGDLNIPEDEQFIKDQEVYKAWSALRPAGRNDTAEYTEWYAQRPTTNYHQELRKRYLDSIDLYFEEVDSYGGEGQGETWYIVYYFPAHELHIRVNGYYQSYNGTEFYGGWDCCKEVKPVQKTITVYE